jgi:hypothetical protein
MQICNQDWKATKAIFFGVLELARFLFPGLEGIELVLNMMIVWAIRSGDHDCCRHWAPSRSLARTRLITQSKRKTSHSTLPRSIVFANGKTYLLYIKTANCDAEVVSETFSCGTRSNMTNAHVFRRSIRTTLVASANADDRKNES